jgi:hypothetical protein
VNNAHNYAYLLLQYAILCEKYFQFSFSIFFAKRRFIYISLLYSFEARIAFWLFSGQGSPSIFIFKIIGKDRKSSRGHIFFVKSPFCACRSDMVGLENLSVWKIPVLCYGLLKRNQGYIEFERLEKQCWLCLRNI